jgi:endonuclease/exonuclease/phosphatase family metal-dependent hydrolase
MTSNTSGQFKLCVTDGSGEGICKSNILSNIASNIKKYNPDFAAFQEASEHLDIIELFDPNIHESHVNTSGKEIMLTLWNKKKFTLVKAYDSEFEEGRPFTIIILKNNRSNKNIAVINLHAGHRIDTQKTIFDIINNYIKKSITTTIKKSVVRVIMSGDFNRNVYEDDTSTYTVNFTQEFILKRFSNNKKTCCSVIGYGHNYAYDHILDSKAIVSKKILGNSVKNYKIPSSDHILIIAKLKN